MQKCYSLLVWLMVFTSGWAQKSDLKLNLETGKTYIQTTHSKSTVEQSVGGQQMTIGMGIKGTMNYLVKAVNADDFEMEVTYKSLMMTMQMPQGSMEFNSEKTGEQDILSKILSGMKDKPFRIRMLKNGKVKEVKDIELVFDGAFGHLPQVPEIQLKQIKDQILKAYGADAFKGNIEMVTAIFPDKPVAQSETWTVNTKLASGMEANMATVYKLTEKTADRILIQGDSKIATENKDAYIENNGMKMRYDLAGSMTSQIVIDPKTGWILEAKILQTLQGEAHIQESEQLPGGMTIPMTMKNDMQISGK